MSDYRLDDMTDERDTALEELAAMKRERDELFTRIADLSWEKMSPREQAVWAAAFAYAELREGIRARESADSVVKKLKEKLK